MHDMRNSPLPYSSLIFLKSKYDASLFLCMTEMGIVILLVYVGDIIITGTNSILISQLK